jgi:hypothetical protein
MSTREHIRPGKIPLPYALMVEGFGLGKKPKGPNPQENAWGQGIHALSFNEVEARVF